MKCTESASGYEIIESFTLSKTGQQQSNEDLIYIGEHYVAVIDGATSTTKETFHGKTGGQLCVEAITTALSELSGREQVDEAMQRICTAISEMEKAWSLIEKGIHCCACAAIYSCARREIWVVGDCQYSVNGTVVSNIKRIDAVYGEVRSILIHALLQSGMTEAELLEQDVSRSLILPLIDRQRSLENSDDIYGYAVFNGERPPTNVHVCSVEPNAEIIFASDGYPMICPTLEESERRLQEILAKDPLCYREIQETKGVKEGNVSFDDRSFLRFRVTG